MHDVSRKRRTDIGEHCNVYHRIMKSILVLRLSAKRRGCSYVTPSGRTGHGEGRHVCMAKGSLLGKMLTKPGQ